MTKFRICVPTWKLPIVERHLKRAGFAYTSQPGTIDGTDVLFVDAQDAPSLLLAVEYAMAEAEVRGRPDVN